MATELNLDVLAGMGFDVPAEAGPNDLVVALRADDADAWRPGSRPSPTRSPALPRPRPTPAAVDEAVAPRTIGSAAARAGATLALVSVPGPVRRGRGDGRARRRACDVMVFSDNVPSGRRSRSRTPRPRPTCW